MSKFSDDHITDDQIRGLRMLCMNGSPLAESCDVALGDLVLDDQKDDEPDIARARIAEFLNARAAKAVR